MAASPNKAVSPKDYTVCVGRQISESILNPSTNAEYQKIHSLKNLDDSKIIPSYSIVGEYIITYPLSTKKFNKKENYYINCVYLFDDILFNKCRYIRLVITPNISYTNSGSLSIVIIFNIEMVCGSNHSGSIELFRKLLLRNGSFITGGKKYAVIYDLKKNEIYIDTDNPIEEWSDSNQLQIYA